MILEYSKKIPQQIPKALKETLGLEVKAVKRLKGGEVNYSFRADTTSGPVIVRVFRYEGWPSEIQVRFVEKKLEGLGIRHSKIIYWKRPDKYFLNGFMVGKWIEGTPGREAKKKKLVTVGEMFSEIAKILKKVHTVKFKKFGELPFTKEKRGEKDFSFFVMQFKERERFKNLIKDNLVSSSLMKAGEKRLQDLLNKIDFPVKSVMVHGDATPHNVIWTRQGPVLIDWDNIKATSWVYDLAWMTYWWGEKVRVSFLKGYGTHRESESEMRLLEKIFHLDLAIGLLSYYAYDVQDKKRLKEGMEKLNKLLEG